MTTTETDLPLVSAQETDVVRGAALRTAAGASVIGGLIHYAAVPEHLSEGWPYGLFFTALGAFGFVWAVRIWFGPNVPLVTAGLSFNIGCIALWAVSRTTGLSFGPQAASGESLNLREFLCPPRTIVRRGHRNSRFLRNICHN